MCADKTTDHSIFPHLSIETSVEISHVLFHSALVAHWCRHYWEVWRELEFHLGKVARKMRRRERAKNRMLIEFSCIMPFHFSLSFCRKYIALFVGMLLARVIPSNSQLHFAHCMYVWLTVDFASFSGDRKPTSTFTFFYKSSLSPLTFFPCEVSLWFA
jgi:hypothetical protein